jgi:hypothetical protein
VNDFFFLFDDEVGVKVKNNNKFSLVRESVTVGRKNLIWKRYTIFNNFYF